MCYGFIYVFIFWSNFRVVALDMRGYGESEKPTGVENYVIDKLDNDLKVITSQLHFIKSHSLLSNKVFHMKFAVQF